MPLHFLQDVAGGFSEFDLGGLEHDVLGAPLRTQIGAGQITDFDVLGRPAVAAARVLEIPAGFRKSDIEAALATFMTRQKELKADGGFACAGVALQQIKALSHKPPSENLVQSSHSAGNSAILGLRHSYPG
jgi:hypothetical protein